MSLNQVSNNSNIQNQLTRISGILQSKLSKSGYNDNFSSDSSLNFQAVMPSFIYNLTYAINGVRKSLQEGIVGIDYSKGAYKEILDLLDEAKSSISNLFNYQINDNEQTINNIDSLSEKLKSINTGINNLLNNTTIATKNIFSSNKIIDSNITKISGSDFNGIFSVPETFTVNGTTYSSNNLSIGANAIEIEFENNIEYDLSKVYGAFESAGINEINLAKELFGVDGDGNALGQILNIYGLKKAGDIGIFAATTSSTTDSKTAAGGGQNTIVFNDADLAAYGNGMNIDDFFVGFTVSLTAGHGYSQTKTITAYNSATRTATLDSDWTTTKDRARNGAALNTIKIDNTSELDDLNFTGATVKILSGAAAGETRVVNSYDAGTNTLTLSSAWNTNITGAVAGAGSGTNSLELEIGDLKNYDNYYYGASVTLTAGITNITKTISGYAKTTNEITVDSDWGVITEQGIANHGGAASAATANTITFAAGASASNNAYVGSTINVNGEIKTITAYNGATQTATVDSDWLDGDGSSIVGQDYALTVEINEHSSYVINDVIANSSSTYEITLASGNYNVPKNGTTYSLNSTGLYAIDLNESSANYLTPYNTGILISGGDSSSLYDITEYDSGKYSILFNDYSDSNKVKIYNFEGSTEQNIFHTSSISVIKNTGSGTALGATANTIQLAATASDIANTYVGSIITVNNESKTITAYDNITKTATVDGAWSDGDGSTISGHNYAFIKDLGIQGGSLSSSYLDADGKMAVLKFTESGYVQSTSNQYITLESSANSQNGYYVGMQVNIGSNVRTITSYNGTTKQAVLDEPLSSRTTATSKYSISHSIMYFDVSDTNYSDAGSITELPDTLTKTTVMPEIFKSSDGNYYIGYSEVAEENTLLEYNNSSMNTIQLSPTSSNEDDYYVGMGFYISNGPGAGTLNTIIDYDGTTKTATIENTFIGTSNCSITAIGATTIKSGALTAATNDYYNNWGIYITDGTGAGQFRRITDYDGTTKTATVESWDITPDTNSKFKLMQLPNTATFNTNNEFTALSGTLTNIRFPVGFNTYNTFYKGYTVFLTGGTGAGQYRDISAYVGTGGAARTATVATNWTTAPVGGNTKFTLMLTDSSAPYTGSSDTAVMQTANSITFDDTYSEIDDYFNGWGVFITEGTGAGQFKKIVDYEGSTKTASIDTNWATTPDASSKFTLVKIYQQDTSYQILSNNIIEIDPANSANNKIVMNGSVSGNTYRNIGLSNDYFIENYRYFSTTPETAISDKYNLINLKPYDDIISSSINASNVSVESITSNINAYNKYIVEDYITFNMIDDTHKIWEVNSQKYGTIGTVQTGGNFWINVNPAQVEDTDSDLEINPNSDSSEYSSKNNFYSVSDFLNLNSFLNLNIADDSYNFGDSFTLRIKDAVIEGADFDNTAGSASIEQKTNYSLTYVDEYGGMFFRNPTDKSIYLAKSIIDFDSSYDSSSLTQTQRIWNTTGSNLPAGKNPVIFENNTIAFLQKTDYMQTIPFSYDFHSDKGNTSVANNFFDGSATKINDDANYSNETIYLTYAGSGNWKVYSNQSGQLTNDTNINPNNYITMSQNGTTTNTFTKTGTDGGKTSIDISIKGWEDFINGKTNANGITPASADEIFSSGDTIQLKLSHQAKASLNGGTKINIYEGRENIIANGDSAVSLTWDNSNQDFYDNIGAGEYSFNVEPNFLKVLSSENIDEIDLKLPNLLTMKQLGIEYDTIKFKTPYEAYTIFDNAYKIVKTEMNHINGMSELFGETINYSNLRLDSLYTGNDKINNIYEANSRLDSIKSEMLSNLDGLKYFNLKSEIVDGLFSFYDNNISV